MREVSFTITGIVEQGSGKARKLGFSTANLTLSEPLTIEEGIYCARASVVGMAESLPSVVFYGVPHALPGVTEPRFEVHVLGLHADFYGKRLTVKLIAFIRENKKFDDRESLQKAIDGDIQQAWKYFQLSSQTSLRHSE